MYVSVCVRECVSVYLYVCLCTCERECVCIYLSVCVLCLCVFRCANASRGQKRASHTWQLRLQAEGSGC